MPDRARGARGWWARDVAAWPDYANYQRETARLIPVFVLEPIASS